MHGLILQKEKCNNFCLHYFVVFQLLASLVHSCNSHTALCYLLQQQLLRVAGSRMGAKYCSFLSNLRSQWAGIRC